MEKQSQAVYNPPRLGTRILQGCVALLLSLFGATLSAETGTVPVAAIFSLTGRGASSNLRFLHGVQLAVEQINADGGLLGRPVELIPLDNESSAVGSVAAVHQAMEKKAIAIIGAAWSAHSLAMAPVAQQAHLPMISNYSTHPKVTAAGNYIFRVCYLDTFQAGVMARFARKDLALQRVAILYERGNEYSEGLAGFFAKEFARRGGTIVAKVPYLKDSLDFTEELNRVKEAHPQAVYLPGYEKETGLLIKEAYKMGIDLPFLGSDSWGDAMPRYLGGVIHEGYEVKPWTLQNPDPISQKFVKDYQKKFGAEELLSGTALAYDAMRLLADAVRRAQSFQPARIRTALAATMQFVGVTGPIRFDAARNPIKGAVINRYQMSSEPQFARTVTP